MVGNGKQIHAVVRTAKKFGLLVVATVLSLFGAVALKEEELLDLMQVFQNSGRRKIEELYIKDGHYSPKGHRLVATEIARYLAARHICSRGHIKPQTTNSYGEWCAWRGSNAQPSAPEADALSN